MCTSCKPRVQQIFVKTDTETIYNLHAKNYLPVYLFVREMMSFVLVTTGKAYIIQPGFCLFTVLGGAVKHLQVEKRKEKKRKEKAI